MKKTEKDQAIKLREKGESIKQIAKALFVSKGSVSSWVRNVKLSNRQQLRLKEREHSRDVVEKRRASRLKNELLKRRVVIDGAKKDIKLISINDLKLIGSALYWAEGRKRGQRVISFSNSDPEIIKIMIRFFREVCGVDKKKFRGHIHTHSHLNAKAAEMYWSHISGIPTSQFYKTYVKPSVSTKGKMDRLPYGTFDITICDSLLYLRVMGWIEKISNLILK